MVDIIKLQDFLKKLSTEYETDTKWDHATSQRFIMSLAGVVAKYINYWSKMKNLLIEVDEEYNEQYYNLYMFYKQDTDIKYTSTEIQNIISRDPNLKEIRGKKEIVVNIMKTLESYIENLNKTRYDISNFVEMEKFLNGR